MVGRANHLMHEVQKAAEVAVDVDKRTGVAKDAASTGQIQNS